MTIRTRASSSLALPLTTHPSFVESSEIPAAGELHKVAGLFAGIGGLERGLRRSGHETAIMCEIDEPARAVLAKRFSEIPVHDDICTLQKLPRETTLIAAGFPCQDLSQAGMTSGIGGTKSALVGEVFRLVEKHRTPWVLLENVPFMLQLGRGEAMNVVATAFEELGYKWAYRVVDARSFGLPQRRRRVYFLASRVGDPRSILFADEGKAIEREASSSNVACGFYWTEGVRGLGWAVDAVPTLKGGSGLGIPSSPAIIFSDGTVATVDIRDAERLQGFPADWTRPAEAIARKGARWKLIGNAVSVPTATWIGRRLAKPGIPLDVSTVPLLRGGAWPSAAWNIGTGRYKAFISERPVEVQGPSLEAFLRYPRRPLSVRATEGFLKRTERASLRFPEGFLDALREHSRRVASQDFSPLLLEVRSQAV